MRTNFKTFKFIIPLLLVIGLLVSLGGCGTVETEYDSSQVLAYGDRVEILAKPSAEDGIQEFIIINHLEDRTLFYGLDYDMEVFKGGEWRAFNKNENLDEEVIVDAIGILLEPGKSRSFEAHPSFYNLELGTYRIVKEFSYYDNIDESWYSASSPFVVTKDSA